jgi:hypothetical protein
MNLTFLQLMAYRQLNDTLDKLDQANALLTATMSARADEKAIKQKLTDLLGGIIRDERADPVSMAKPIKMRSRQTDAMTNGKIAASDDRRQEAPGKPGEARQEC